MSYEFSVGDVVEFLLHRSLMAPEDCQLPGYQFTVRCARGDKVWLFNGQKDMGDICPCGRHSWVANVRDVTLVKRDSMLNTLTTEAHYNFDFGFYSSIYKSILKEKKKSMSLSTIAKRLLDADTRNLIKAGFLDTELNLTSEGRHAMWAILFESNKAALVSAAQEVLDEKKAEK